MLLILISAFSVTAIYNIWGIAPMLLGVDRSAFLVFKTKGLLYRLPSPTFRLTKGHTEMEYIIERNGRYHFNRRVPVELANYDPRRFVQKSLKTDSRKMAIKKAAIYNQQLESYWHTLVSSNKAYDTITYQALRESCKYFGFEYHPVDELVNKPIMDIVTRLFQIDRQKENKAQVEAVLGAAPAPRINVQESLERYWDLSKHLIVNKSPDQIRKWRNPRKRAIKYFINCVGNKTVQELTREDTLKFRDWWIDRIIEGTIKPLSAEKNITFVKCIISEVVSNLKIDLDLEHLFKKLDLPEDSADSRKPFETNHIISMFEDGKLDGLCDEGRYMLYASAETGAGCSELVGLRPEDICLDHEIPHIKIEPYDGHKLKTKFRKRIIPLVGYALEAFKQFPEGFAKYRGNPDNLSNAVGKYLRENDLLPTDKHSAYSLRHSFQDRLTNADVPDRTQVDLMGHQFDRQKYGAGPSLEKKAEWLKKIQLKLK